MQLYNGDSGGTRPSFNIPYNLGEEHDDNGHQAQAENGRPEFDLAALDIGLGEDLNPYHLQMLIQGSSLSEEVVRERGYRTVETKAELKRLGFADAQCNPPGLLVPTYSPTGEISNYQFRPDQPRIKDGRPIRYETPQGSRMVLDVHPFARDKLGDPSVPLFITEGVKKGDVLISHGLCAVALLGVWNWRGRNEHGGLTALPEWEHIALNDRQIYIVFDSDVMLKPQVHSALARLKAFLEVR
jgi:Domain of unknown function (DUF3854)